MKFYKYFVASLLFTASINLVFAQSKPVQKSNTAAKPLKIVPPKLKTFLGIVTDSMVIPLDQAKAILGTPLKVIDDKNNILTITYYQFLYKRKAVVEDEETGKLKATSSIVSDYFTTTPLPAKWVKLAREQLVPGEELFFFDIIAKDSQGHPFYAPNLKIITK